MLTVTQLQWNRGLTSGPLFHICSVRVGRHDAREHLEALSADADVEQMPTE